MSVPRKRDIDDHLYEFLVGWTKIRERAGLAPVASSRGDQELAKYKRRKSIGTVISIAGAQIESAHDHLWAVARLISSGDSAMAPWTCARATIEAAALAKWLLSPNASADERVKRSLSLRYQSIRAQQKIVRARRDFDRVALAEEKIVALERIATELGFDPILGKDKKRIGVGCMAPVITDLIENELGEHDLYRQLCGIAHSDHLALRRLAMEVVEQNDEGFVVVRTPAADLRTKLVPTTVAAFARAIWAYGDYMGVERDGLVSILDRCYDRLGQPKGTSARFWLPRG